MLLTAAGGGALPLRSGGTLTVLSQQAVRAPLPDGRLLTSWLLSSVAPAAALRLPAELVSPLLPSLDGRAIASSGWLPPSAVRAFLLAGASAVVCAASAEAVRVVDPAAAAAFWVRFYAALGGAGCDLAEAVRDAEPAAGVTGVWRCWVLEDCF